ncbi:MAG TPA: DNRLRE domain-containing protein [Candidatus Margulisiibacteriota bacterium]|nr:DNRLRE domain-containing protein [Candidatus Margulisiibacteriota bacterium]
MGLVACACVAHSAAADSVRLIGDAYTKSTAPNSNFGAATSLLVLGPPVSTTVENVYLQFDLSTLPAGTTGNDIAKATLTVGVNKITHAGAVDVVRITSAWTEAGVTAARAPSLGAPPEATLSVTAADKNDFRAIDVTQLVKDWLDTVLPNNGLALVPNPAGISVQFDSKESTGTSHWPQLEISLVTPHQFGGSNTGIGNGALVSDTSGGSNTAVGASALTQNTTGNGNTAVGASTLVNNTTGAFNTAVGLFTLNSNTTGLENTALGSNVLSGNTTGDFNTAVGFNALNSNTTGVDNTALGTSALAGNTTGAWNVAVGDAALSGNTTGIFNIALGPSAGANLTTGSANICIGNLGVAAEANTIRLGTAGAQTATYIAGINGASASGGVPVFVDSAGKLGTSPAAGATAGQALTFDGSNWTPSSVVNSLTAGSGLSASASAGSVSVSLTNGGVTNGMLANSSVTVNASSGLSGGGTVALGGSTTLSNAGVLSVDASDPLASSGGQNPSISLLGTVPVTNGGTGASTASGALSNLGAAANGANADITALSGITGNIALPDSASATAGNIFKGGSRFLHNFGNDNTFVGENAGNFSMSGGLNSALGRQALLANTTGFENTAVGAEALYSNADGGQNTAVGAQALQSNKSGVSNTAVGFEALYNQTGGGNTAVGNQALVYSTGVNNIAIGVYAGANLTTGNSNIDIGNLGLTSESDTIRIGTVGTHTGTYIAGINGATSSSGVAVYVNANGQLGTTTSSARFKDDIQDMGDSTSKLMKLRPVRFRYKKDIDPSGLEQYGLVAEEVAKVYPDLVVYDDQGKAQTVRYHFVNAMLLNEVQKQHRQIAAQAQEISELKARLEQIESAIHTRNIAPASYRP